MSVSTLQTVKKDITFRSGASKLAANLYVPPGFDEAGSYPSVVFSPPFNQVKEQTGAVYGRHLAKHGYITLVFDHIGYGDSEGAIRNNENAFVKIETIRDAISFMCTLSYVDRDRLFGLGICASGTYMALVAATDKRLKAIATVSGMMNNQTSYFGSMDRPTITALILAQNAGRQKAYETGEVDYVDALGLSNAEGAPKEGYDYYMTARAGAQTYPNYSHLSPSFMLEAPMIADAQTYAKYLYTPYIGIYGEKANDPENGPLATASFTINFYNAASEPKELVEIDGASHVSLYDIEQDVCRAVEAMIRFFERHGGKQTRNTT